MVADEDDMRTEDQPQEDAADRPDWLEDSSIDAPPEIDDVEYDGEDMDWLDAVRG